MALQPEGKSQADRSSADDRFEHHTARPIDIVILPLVVLLLGQLTGVLYLDELAVLLLAGFVWLFAGGTLVIGYRSFRPERLLVGA